jgi:hypothetical protein
VSEQLPSGSLAGRNSVSPAIQLHDDLPLWPPFELVDDVLEQTRTDLPGLIQLTTVNEAASMRRTFGPGKATRLVPTWRYGTVYAMSKVKEACRTRTI